MKIQHKIIGASIIAGTFIWVIDAVLDFLFFHEGSFLQVMGYQVHPHHLFIRLVGFGSFLIFGIILAKVVVLRKKAEDNFNYAHSDLNQIFNAAVPLCVIDKNFRMLRVNDTFSSLFGMKRGKIIGKKCHEIIWGPLCNTHICPMKQILSGMERSEHEVTKKLNNGKTIPCIVTAIPYRSPTGKLLGIVENFTDITERKGIEKALEEEKDFNVNMLTALVDTVFVFDPKTGKPLRWNKAMNEVSGNTDEEIAAKKAPDDWYSREDVKCAAATIEKVFQEGRGTVEISLIGKNGKNIPTEYSVSTVKDKEGNPKYIIAVGRDLTERKRNEEILKKRTYALGERVKELNCLCAISNLAEKQKISLEELFQCVVDLIPSAWQYTEITCARIMLNGQVYKTNNFKETIWKQGSDIIMNDNQIGTLEIFYLEEKSENDEGPFQKEERTLINIIAERLGEFTERKKAEEELKKYHLHLEELVKERTVGLASANENLRQEVIQRKKIEEFLGKSEERWRKYFELGLIGIAVTSPQKKWIEVNDYLCRILGYSRQELMKMTWAELTYPENFESDLEKFNGMVIGEVDGINTETRFVREDGRIIDASISTRCLRNQDGTIEYFLVLVQDITARKKAESSLKKSEENYKTLVENSRDLIFTLDLKGNFIFTNKAFEIILGYTPEELKKINGFELIHREDLETVKERFNKLINGKVQNDMEYRYKTKEGSYINMLNNAVPLFDPQENVVAALSISRDITERKRMEKALRESEIKYSTLVEKAKDGVSIVQGTTFKFVNKALADITGYTVDELIEKPFMDIIAPELREPLAQIYKSRIAGEEISTHTETKIKCKDGTIKDVESSSCIIKYNDQPAVMTITRDVTEHKKMEEEIQKMDKLEAIGVLAGGIAHDFNNLLTGILGNLSMAELYAKPEDNIFKILQRAKKASKRAGQLTKQLLTFSKGGAPIKQTASISELIEDTAIFALRGSKVRCEYSLPDNLWPVEIDKGQISQIINNLIINAHHAMPDGGIITISAENIIINENNRLPLKEGRYIKVSVKDQGIGISKEHLGKIFDPYFTTKEHGSGLGLASCYSIAKNHGGFITVESEIGAGTRFDIYLPYSDKEVFEVKEIVEKKVFQGKGTILFMDDEEEVISAAQKMIVQLGYKIKMAKNGTEAINMYKRAKKSGEPFDLVILDLTIPGEMGGEKTIKRLLEIDPDVKAIVSSGYSNNPIMAEYKKCGFKGVVAKPYEIQQLSKILYKVINGKEKPYSKVV